MTETIIVDIYVLISLLAIVGLGVFIGRNQYRKWQDKKYKPEDWVDRCIRDQWGRDAYIKYKATHPDGLDVPAGENITEAMIRLRIEIAEETGWPFPDAHSFHDDYLRVAQKFDNTLFSYQFESLKHTKWTDSKLYSDLKKDFNQVIARKPDESIEAWRQRVPGEIATLKNEFVDHLKQFNDNKRLRMFREDNKGVRSRDLPAIQEALNEDEIQEEESQLQDQQEIIQNLSAISVNSQSYAAEESIQSIEEVLQQTDPKSSGANQTLGQVENGITQNQALLNQQIEQQNKQLTKQTQIANRREQVQVAEIHEQFTAEKKVDDHIEQHPSFTDTNLEK